MEEVNADQDILYYRIWYFLVLLYIFSPDQTYIYIIIIWLKIRRLRSEIGELLYSWKKGEYIKKDREKIYVAKGKRRLTTKKGGFSSQFAFKDSFESRPTLQLIKLTSVPS